jgi:hypothetical protein
VSHAASGDIDSSALSLATAFHRLSECGYSFAPLAVDRIPGVLQTIFLLRSGNDVACSEK